MDGTQGAQDIDAVAASLTEKLVGRFSGAIAPEVVAKAVEDCVSGFREARIVAFLPILLERRCLTQLSSLTVTS